MLPSISILQDASSAVDSTWTSLALFAAGAIGLNIMLVWFALTAGKDQHDSVNAKRSPSSSADKNQEVRLNAGDEPGRKTS